ncbi:VWA domain-containing protein [Mobilicoccus massiliensis]|uniref:VWA domain-containing protein n=1 Tax=Mobilicoccus massiliensis TaxID=1522310 RepID=UPI0009E261CF|nr:VWA domain-containing protein [Mobilicoccus massiliensis]
MSENRAPDASTSTGDPGSKTTGSSTFPFSAVVGMDDMGLALCLAAVSPGIGGVLVRGEKGTAKSTMVRALAAVLPPVEVIGGCRFACDPRRPDPACPDLARHSSVDALTRPVRLVELPVGASEDRVVGSLHLDELLSRSKVEFEPGLLAQAHRGILYVDEVNLLPDHLVDTLLDSAAMGRARVEREGVSVSHAAQFVLVGTMNPEEGELRPQLLDRFGLAVDVAASREVDVRVEVVRRRMAFEADPAGFVAGYAGEQRELADRIARAEHLLPQVVLTDAAVRQISTICAEFDVDGMRGDLVTARTACAHAAWCGRTEVTGEDVRVAARLAPPHRRRRSPFDDHSGDDLEDILDETLGEEPPEPPDDDPAGPDDDPPGGGPDDGAGDGSDDGDDDGGDGNRGAPPEPTEPPEPQETPEPQHSSDAGETGTSEAEEAQSPPRPNSAGSRGTQGTRPDRPYRTRLFALPHAGAGVAGRRSSAEVATGRHVRAVRPEDPRGRGLALTSTIVAAASRLDGDSARKARPSRCEVEVGPGDLRRSVRRGKEGNLVVFAVDTSGSMGAAERIRQVKTACVSLLLDAYQRRDKVAVVTFSGREARVVLPPTSSVDLAERLLAEVPTGGRTPLAEGLTSAYEVLRRERVRDPHRRALLVVLTDGRASAGGRTALPRAHRVADGIGADAARTGQFGTVVVDCESARAGFRLGLARDLAGRLGAEYVDLAELGGSLVGHARPA